MSRNKNIVDNLLSLRMRLRVPDAHVNKEQDILARGEIKLTTASGKHICVRVGGTIFLYCIDLRVWRELSSTPACIPIAAFVRRWALNTSLLTTIDMEWITHIESVYSSCSVCDVGWYHPVGWSQWRAGLWMSGATSFEIVIGCPYPVACKGGGVSESGSNPFTFWISIWMFSSNKN